MDSWKHLQFRVDPEINVNSPQVKVQFMQHHAPSPSPIAPSQHLYLNSARGRWICPNHNLTTDTATLRVCHFIWRSRFACFSQCYSVLLPFTCLTDQSFWRMLWLSLIIDGRSGVSHLLSVWTILSWMARQNTARPSNRMTVSERNETRILITITLRNDQRRRGGAVT